MINCKVCDSKLKYIDYTSLLKYYQCTNDGCIVYAYYLYNSFMFIEIRNYILHLHSFSYKNIIFVTDSFDNDINQEFLRHFKSDITEQLELWYRENCFEFLIKFKENLLLI